MYHYGGSYVNHWMFWSEYCSLHHKPAHNITKDFDHELTVNEDDLWWILTGGGRFLCGRMDGQLEIIGASAGSNINNKI